MDTWNNNNEMLLQAVRELTTKIAAMNKKKVDTALLESLLANYLTKDEADTLIDEKIAAALEHALDDYATITGYFPEMSVGFSDLARQLDTDLHVTDTAPYLFRTAGGTAEIGDREEDEIVGGTVAENQLVKVPATSISKTENGITFTDNRDGSYSVSGTASADTTLVLSDLVTALPYHKGILFGCPTGGSLTTYYLRLGSSNTIPDTGNGFIYYRNASSSNAWNPQIVVRAGTVITGTIVFRPQYTDLTQEFGTEIADYAYTLEQAQAGSGINWLKSYGFFQSYIPYNAGTLVSVSNLTSHRMVGFNQLPTSVIRGHWWSNAGVLDTSKGDNYGACDTVFPIVPSQILCVAPTKTTARGTWYVSWRDGNGELITIDSQSVAVGDHALFTAPSNAYYATLATYRSTDYALSELEEVNVNYSWDEERDGQYEPYKVYNYPLDDSIVLRGVPTLVNGQIVYDGDRWMPSGEVPRRYAEVDLGSLTWEKSVTAGRYYFYSPPIDAMGAPVGTAIANAICTKYTASAYGDAAGDNPVDKSLAIASSTQRIYIYDSAYASADANTFATAMNGVKLVYELATPTTEQATPYQTPQIVDNWGTEEYVGSPIPVGHSTKYPLNMRAKLEAMADNPSTDGEYVLAGHGVHRGKRQALHAPVPQRQAHRSRRPEDRLRSGG